ncbi:MAG: glutathione-disulfide reductase [Zetaproteobacteria bacterium]|nr:glutathione-disulfide reductase [Zetaproteobacteria bacterium]
MTEHKYDLCVIGGGSGGVRAARIASTRYGKKVCLVESKKLGGTCVNVGCVPKKLFYYAAAFAENVQDATGFGWKCDQVAFSWPALIQNKNEEIARLNGVYNSILENSAVKVIEGKGRLKDAHTVVVDDGLEISADKILIATGSTPYVPSFPGAEACLVSDQMFSLDQLPKSIGIIGGGYIAVEFASLLCNLGVEVSLIYRGCCLLTGFDRDIGERLERALSSKGIKLIPDAVIESVGDGKSSKHIHLKGQPELEVEQVLLATGRVPMLAGLGLEDCKVALNEKGGILVNDDYQTSVSSIYAIGDVITRMALTPVAIEEAMVFVERAYEGKVPLINYDVIPTSVFTEPNVGTCGLSEVAAKAKYGDVAVYESEYRPLKATLSGRNTKEYMKVIVDKASDRVVGLHVLGYDAAEIVQGFGVAMLMGATKSQFDATVGIHPTSAEELVTLRTPRV